MKRLARALLLVVIVFSVGRGTFAVEIPPQHHAWGRFQPNSWSRVRVITETFGGGKTTSEIKFITTKLVRVDEDGVVLTREIEKGDRVTREENVKYAWDGSKNEPQTQEKYSLGEVDVDGKTHTCQTHQRTTKDDVAVRVSKSWYCPDQSPYFLKRITRVTGKSLQTTVMRVTHLAVTKTVVDKPLVCWQSETTFAGPGEKARTTSYGSMDVPGGLVSSQSEVTHPQQGVKRRVRQELIEYQALR